MKEVAEDEDWTIFWTDYSVSLERVMEMKRFQVSQLFIYKVFQKSWAHFKSSFLLIYEW